MKNRIKRIIKKYPNFFIYYHDNREWVIYSSAKDVDTETGEESKKPVLEGDDYNCMNGYIPELVEALTELLGGSVFSI